MATHKPFRELVRPGSNFEFVGRSRLWTKVSALLIVASIATLFINKSVRGNYLNWTIDFKGGTEIRYGFIDKETNKHIVVSSGDIRQTLTAAGYGGIEVSDFSWTETNDDGSSETITGMLVRTPTFGALDAEERTRIRDAFREKFADRELLTIQWSGNRLFARTKKVITEAEGRALFAEFKKETKDWGDQTERFTTANEATGEYELEFTIWGLERQFANELEAAFDGVEIELVQSEAVGARAGEELRNDGLKSLFYAIALIMLYLAFRFDIRYAPGAVAALLHDATLVVGIFAVTWTDVSLTSVAALLTVIGYSVNDTVVIFDRIRENVGRLKDKKLARVINISLNETLSRTLLTSLTLLVVTLMMNFFGAGVVRNFAFTLNIGVVVGVYSSVFVASPVLLYLDTKYYGGRAASARGKKAQGKSSGSGKKK